MYIERSVNKNSPSLSVRNVQKTEELEIRLQTLSTMVAASHFRVRFHAKEVLLHEQL